MAVCKIKNTLVEVIQGDITEQDVDIIVNAANSGLLGGGGVDGAIHRAGGPAIMAECIKIRNAMGGCPTGEAVLTTGGKLKASCVIHTVGPIWHGGTQAEDSKLRACYRNCLKLAGEYQAKSIAIPNISTRVYYFPKERATRIAWEEVSDYLLTNESSLERVIFVCFDKDNFALYQERIALALRQGKVELQKISPQTIAITFNTIASYLTHTYLLDRAGKYYLIDTYNGPDIIKTALELSNIDPGKEIVVINTHFHWDHVWGNCAFPDHKIISHKLCREYLDQCWDDQLEKNRAYVTGAVTKVLPNWTFTDKIWLEDAQLELFHSPGHTQDSISVFDHQEKTLYVGDNLERPIIYVESNDLATYIKTLENYSSYQPERIISGHTLDLSEADIQDAIAYLQALQAGEKIVFRTEYERSIHQQNLNTLKNTKKVKSQG